MNLSIINFKYFLKIACFFWRFYRFAGKNQCILSSRCSSIHIELTYRYVSSMSIHYKYKAYKLQYISISFSQSTSNIAYLFLIQNCGCWLFFCQPLLNCIQTDLDQVTGYYYLVYANKSIENNIYTIFMLPSPYIYIYIYIRYDIMRPRLSAGIRHAVSIYNS